ALERLSGYTNLSELLTQGGTQTDVLGRTTPLGQVFDPSTTRAVFCGMADPVTGLTPPSGAGTACPTGTPAGTQAGFVREPFTGIADGGSFSAGDQTAKSWNIALSETHTFSPLLVNEARIGVNRIDTTRVQPFSNDLRNIPNQFGIQGVPQVPSNGGLGTIFITGLNTLGSNQFLPSIETSQTSQYTDNLTKVWGEQTMKFGFEHQHLRFTILQPPSGRGAWSFSGAYAEVPSPGGGKTGLPQLRLTPI